MAREKARKRTTRTAGKKVAERKAYNYYVVGFVAIAFIAIAFFNYFNFIPGGVTGYSIAEVREMEAEEAAPIIWPTAERPTNSNEFEYEVTRYGDITIDSRDGMPGVVTLKFPRKVLVGSYMLIRRDGEKINMGFTMMRGREMFTGIKSAGVGSYVIEYLVKLDDGSEHTGTISFDVGPPVASPAPELGEFGK